MSLILVKGSFRFDKPVDPEFIARYGRYAETKHCLRDNERIMREYPDWKDRTLFGTLGRDGEFFIGPTAGEEDDTVIDAFHGHAGSPYTQWRINADGTELIPGQTFPWGGMIDVLRPQRLIPQNNHMIVGILD